jgi:hypothetical protein
MWIDRISKNKVDDQELTKMMMKGADRAKRYFRNRIKAEFIILGLYLEISTLNAVRLVLLVDDECSSGRGVKMSL